MNTWQSRNTFFEESGKKKRRKEIIIIIIIIIIFYYGSADDAFNHIDLLGGPSPPPKNLQKTKSSKLFRINN
jgi:hypothetical protein